MPAEATKVHTKLLKCALEVEDSRAYWQHADPAQGPSGSAGPGPGDAERAFEEYWFGAKSLSRIKVLLSNFRVRYAAYPDSLAVLHGWRRMDPETRTLICHWHLQLADPLYRDFTGAFLPERRDSHRPEVTRDLVVRWVEDQGPGPAVGSGHFLVVACELLFALYQEEARHRGEVGEPQWTDAAIVERILSHNLHGIDLDARAVQIAAAALWLKAKQLAPDASVQRMNLVASALRLSSLPDDDPALLELRRGVESVGIEPSLTDRIVEALAGADHLGSLLQVDKAVRGALAAAEGAIDRQDACSAASRRSA